MRARNPLLIACLAGLLAPGAAQAQFRLAPDWAEKPDAERLSDRYPKLAQGLSLQGKVLLSCRVTIPTGVVQRCSVLDEQPKGLGFGAAALAMTRDFQMRPPLAPGARDPGDEVRIPINFKLPDAPRPPVPDADPARLALARRIVEVLRFDEAATRRVEGDARRMARVPEQGVETATSAAAAEALRGALPEVLPVWREALAGVLASRMSERDLAAAAAFAATPEGRRYFEGMARLTLKRGPVEAEARRRARAATREAFCARVSCDRKSSAEDASAALGSGEAPEPIIAWDRRPTPEDLRRAWPLARSMDLNGFAVLVCVIGTQGAPEECRTAGESPAGLGVGAAALSLTDRYRLPAARVTGGMVGRRVLVMTAFLDIVALDSGTYRPPAVTPARRALGARLLEVLQRHWTAPAWEEALRRETEAMSVLPPEPQSAAVAALRTGYEAGDRTFRELSADLICSELDEATLRAAIAFETGEGAALRRAMVEADEELDVLGRAMLARLSDVAGARFCRSFDCGPAGLQPSALSSAPSTRTP